MKKNVIDKKEMFESIPIPKALASMAVPTVISQLINLVYNIVDAFYIGRTGNSYMMAAVTVAFTIFMMNIAFSNLFGIGGGSLMARLIGVAKDEEAKNVSAFSVWASVGIALLYSLFIGLFMTPILNLLGASENTLDYAKQYVIWVVVIGNLPMILSATLAHLLRNVGYAKQASMGLSGGGVLNIVLDPLFMFVLLPEGNEVMGAAIATMISNTAACIYLIVIFLKVSKNAPISMDIRRIKFVSADNYKGLFLVGVPSAILTGLFDVANIFLNSIMSTHGDLPLAAIGIVMKAERLPNAINIGICQGMLPLVAYNYSSGNIKRRDETIKVARVFGLLICVASVILFEIFATPIGKFFMSTSGENPTEALLTIGFATTFLRIRCLASPFQFINFSSSYCMQAMGDGRDTLIHAVVRELVFYIPFMYLLNYFFNENGLAGALVLGEACGAAFAAILLRSWMKNHAK